MPKAFGLESRPSYNSGLPTDDILDLLVSGLLQNKPAIVPAPGTLGVADDHPLRLVQTFGAKWVIFGETSEFAE